MNIRRSPAVTLPALLAGAVAGCSFRDRPGYNPYAPPGGDPPLLQRAEATLNVADDALNEPDVYLENAVY